MDALTKRSKQVLVTSEHSNQPTDPHFTMKKPGFPFLQNIKKRSPAWQPAIGFWNITSFQLSFIEHDIE